eukprot:11514583-Karenia_brevis.AAC.1
MPSRQLNQAEQLPGRVTPSKTLSLGRNSNLQVFACLHVNGSCTGWRVQVWHQHAKPHGVTSSEVLCVGGAKDDDDDDD